MLKMLSVASSCQRAFNTRARDRPGWKRIACWTALPSTKHSRPAWHLFSSLTPAPAELGRIGVKRLPIKNLVSIPWTKAELAGGSGHRNTSDSTPQTKQNIWRPLLFSVGISLLGFGLAVEVTNQDTHEKIEYIRNHQSNFPNWFSKTFSSLRIGLEPSDAQLQQIRKLEKLEFIRRTGLNHILPHQVLTWYINLGEGKQICLILGLINLQVFALWQVPRLTRFMTNHFTHNPLSGKSYTLISSTFSHSTSLHFAFNMLALYSIGSTAHDSLTHRLRASRDPDPVLIPESTPAYHFLAFYLFGKCCSMRV